MVVGMSFKTNKLWPEISLKSGSDKLIQADYF